MDKIDFKHSLKNLYQPPQEFVIVDVPDLAFIMADGHGDPNTAQEYQEVLEALYATAYKIKFISKKSLGKDYVVPPLEGLWWAEDPGAFKSRDKTTWDWTMMILVPEWITAAIFEEAVLVVRKAKDPIALERLRLEHYQEGLAVQILHMGSYDEEGPILDKMHTEFLPANGFVENGKHHEIYLSDPRRTTPEKLKTVLRQPVRER